MKKKIVLFGLGEMGEVVNFYLSNDSQYEVAGFTVDGAFLKESSFCSLPVVPFEQVEKDFPPDEYGMMVAIGYSKINAIREQKYLDAKAKGYEFATYISSKATTWPGAKVGENSIVFEDNTIQPFTSIGANVVMWSGNHLGHHSRIADHCFVTSHVVVSGGVNIESNCFLGVNATIRDHIRIGKGCVIGMGVTVLNDVPANTMLKATAPDGIALKTDSIRI